MLRHTLAAAAALTLSFAPAAFSQAPAPASANPAAAPAGTYKLDPRHASLAAKVSHLGFSNYTMLLRGLDGELTYNPKRPTASKLNVRVDPRSVDTGLPDFDKEIGEDPRFFAGQPITFVSRSLQQTGQNRGRLTGDLTFRGVTKPVTLDVTMVGAGQHPMNKKPVMGFSATGSIKRSDFGFTHLSPMIGDEVQLQIEAEFAQS